MNEERCPACKRLRANLLDQIFTDGVCSVCKANIDDASSEIFGQPGHLKPARLDDPALFEATP